MPYPIRSSWRPMKVFDDKTGHLDGAVKDSLAGKTRKQPNKERLDLNLM